MNQITIEADGLNLPCELDGHELEVIFEYEPPIIGFPDSEDENVDILSIEDEDGNDVTWLLDDHRVKLEQAVLSKKNEGFDDYDL
jgi:hypothetical protein